MKEWLQARLNSLEGFAFSKLLPAVIILVVGILVVRLLLKVLTKALEKSKMDKALIKLIRSLLRVVLYLLLILITVSSLGVDVTGIVALASVLTLAVSLALQNTLSNVIGGFTLLNTKPFVAGDFVEIGGQSGTVTDVGLNYTKLATADNKIVSMPNSTVVAGQIINYTASGTRRVDITVCASYDMPSEQVLVALREAGQVPTALNEPAPFAGVKNYGESTVEYVLQVWTKSEDYWTTFFDATANVKTTFDKKDVRMSYPHLNVHLDK